MSPAIPLAVGWGGALLVAGLDGRRRWVGWLSLLLGAAHVALLCVLAADVFRFGPQSVVSGGWPAQLGIHWRADALGVLFALASAALVLAVLAFEVAQRTRPRFVPALVLFLATGLSGIFLTGDVFNFYVFFELAMVSGFALAAYGRGAKESRAATVFVIINLVGSVMFLAAVAIIYRVTGTLEMAAVARAIETAPPGVTLLIASLILVAFGLKLGLFPFHYWLPVVYRETNPAIAALFAGALANLASYGLLRFGGEILAGVLLTARPLLLALGTASTLYGSVMAIRRRSFRDMLAYSSIGQVGYTVLALAVGGTAGLAAATLYTLVNSLHKTALFMGSAAGGRGVAALMLLAGLSMAGLPPSAGFVGKVALLRAGIAADQPLVLAVVLAGSALTLLYVVDAWQRSFWSERRERMTDAPPAARAVLVLLVAGTIALGAWPTPLVESSFRAVAGLGGTP